MLELVILEVNIYSPNAWCVFHNFCHDSIAKHTHVPVPVTNCTPVNISYVKRDQIAVEVRVWISNHIPHKTIDVIIYSGCTLSSINHGLIFKMTARLCMIPQANYHFSCLSFPYPVWHFMTNVLLSCFCFLFQVSTCWHPDRNIPDKVR